MAFLKTDKMLRTEEQKQEILSRLEPTRVIEDCLPESLHNKLLDAYWTGEKNQKNTGPITVDYFPNKMEATDWWLETKEFITEYIGEHGCFASNFFHVKQPHVLHNDDSVRWVPRLHKTVVIPLEITEPTNFTVFDQCYLDGPVKLRHGANLNKKQDSIVYYNQNLLDNSLLENYTGKDFDKDTWDKYFTHIAYERFHGLSIECMAEWKPGSIIIFDTARIHCATNFMAQGIKEKIGYSIFTNL